ncbi:uncharacterized protein LDX57_003520 [Aspergillus melleus]|uniref:uncharacterized protein n=1 Tax=Aspergillus melleus TaxID=138277 RepID=UPI001E8CD44E|nr:uncharacterized protein LDX57_003520 [Aspergillus melleus]KAH8425776.1 hypothetical protein LDX57_003520 [Aspergillus melleus]
MAPSSSSPPNGKRYVQLRPKEGRLLITFPDGTSGSGDFRRKKHAQSQKNQRDRLKGAFEQMAQVLRDGGVDHAGKGATKVSARNVELLEAAVEYIQQLQRGIQQAQTER